MIFLSDDKKVKVGPERGKEVAFVDSNQLKEILPHHEIAIVDSGNVVAAWQRLVRILGELNVINTISAGQITLAMNDVVFVVDPDRKEPPFAIYRIGSNILSNLGLTHGMAVQFP
jgi:hypothetical protein